MDTATYDKHWAVFLAAAGPVVQAARELLMAAGLKVDPQDVEEFGDEKGIALHVQPRSTGDGDDLLSLYVDLRLLDGDDAGLAPAADTGEPAVAVGLYVIDESGNDRFKHIPMQYTAELGVHSGRALIQRITDHFTPDAIATVVEGVAARHFVTPTPSAAVPQIVRPPADPLASPSP